MGPDNISEMYLTNNLQALNLPKLHSDGSNWSTYQEHILNFATSKGLKRHLMGTMQKLVILTEQDGEFYKGSNPNLLSKEDVEKHQREEDRV